mmetsp:Transcript_36459/g.32722  ORF Transcript_36459/g.32722 Transcript_36459/m.32722 type:complete len:325 (-) Transcript_36459:69-1043(-)
MPSMPPPIPPEGAALSSLTSTIIASVVVIREATEAASTKAVLTTLVGSMIPFSIMFTYSPVAALKPISSLLSSKILPTITAPSSPAFSAMVLHGILIAFLTMSIPTFWSKLSPFKFSRTLEAYKRAQPPPTTIPSSTAALVALRASVILSLISPTSTSEAPPTLMIPTPPESLASLSWSFSLSYSEVVMGSCSLICSHLSWIDSFDPAPSMMIVSSLEIKICLAVPRWLGSALSKLSPISSERTVPPVKIAISFIWAFLLSPNAGGLTAQTFKPPLSLFKTKVAKASLSTSSAMMRRGLFCLAACSRRGRIVWMLLIFFSQRRT